MTEPRIKLLSIFSLSSCLAFALPDPKKADILAKYGIDPGDIGGATVLMDHESNTIYVGPKAKNKMEGNFAFSGGSISCEDLNKIRHITHRYPDDSEVNTVVDTAAYYSPAFDASFGVYAKNKKILDEFQDAIAQTASYIKEHKQEYGAYVSTLTLKDMAESNLVSLMAEIATIQSEFNSQMNNVLATMQGADRDTAMAKIHAQYWPKLTDLYEKRTELSRTFEQAQKAYSAALKAWAPYRDEFQWLIDKQKALKEGFSFIQTLANDSLTRSIDLINNLEKKVVGTTSVSYNVFGDEVERLRSALSNRGISVGVSRLPIFDIKLNFGVSKNVSSSSNSDGANPNTVFDYNLTTVNLPSDTQTLMGTLVGKDSGLKTLDGRPLHILYGDTADSFGGSGSINGVVTQGAYCGAPVIATKSEITYTGKNGMIRRTVTKTNYNSPGTHNIFTQDVALRYKYYAKSEPMSGTCTLKVSKMSEYWNTSGRDSSWTLFGGSKTTTWDDSKNTYRNEMGLSCSITQRPVGINPDDSKRINDALESAVYQDMFAMFIMEYAKDYKMVTDPKDIPTSDPHPLASAGSGILTLCGGASKYCAITGIALKSLDEMVGSRHAGSTSSTIDVQGTISRKFDKDSYFVSEGQAAISLTVKPSL